MQEARQIVNNLLQNYKRLSQLAVPVGNDHISQCEPRSSNGHRVGGEMLEPTLHNYDVQHHPLRRFSPISPIRIFRPNPYLEIAFDVRTRNPVYVLERILVKPTSLSTSSSPSANKRLHFYEEKSLPEMYRSRNASYHRSGYDRGHLAAAANYASTWTDDDDDNASMDRSLLKDTYNLCNVSPQHPRFNATAWARLEDWTRRVAQYYHNEHNNELCDTYVVTGPLWLPVRSVHPDPQLISNKRDASNNSSKPPHPYNFLEYQYLGLGPPPHVVAVPTHFFKLVVVVRRNSDTIRAFVAFVCPNSEPSPQWKLEDGLVSWTDLEAVSGLQFFTNLVDDNWKIQSDSLLILPPNRNQSRLLMLPASTTDEFDTDSTAPSSSRSKSILPWRRPNNNNSRRLQSTSTTATHLCPNGCCPKYQPNRK